jgi:hypothetical protein
MPLQAISPAVLFWLLSALVALAAEAEKNRVRLRRAPSAKIEIEVTSSRPFPVVNAMAVLHVGKQQTSLSRYGPDGSLNTLIFSMDARDFARTRDGDRVLVRYDPDSQGHWDFGPLEKKRLQ